MGDYCTILINSSCLVTCDHHEEMSISLATIRQCNKAKILFKIAILGQNLAPKAPKILYQGFTKQPLDHSRISKTRWPWGNFSIRKSWLKAILELGGNIAASPNWPSSFLWLYKLHSICAYISTRAQNFWELWKVIKTTWTPKLVVFPNKSIIFASNTEASTSLRHLSISQQKNET